jgi:hypothetical protein
MEVYRGYTNGYIDAPLDWARVAPLGSAIVAHLGSTIVATLVGTIIASLGRSLEVLLD